MREGQRIWSVDVMKCGKESRKEIAPPSRNITEVAVFEVVLYVNNA